MSLHIKEERKLDGHQKIDLSNKTIEPTEKASPGDLLSRWRDWKPLENDSNLDQHGPIKKNDPG
jgi:hypothetical protein